MSTKECCIHFFSYENDFMQALVYVNEVDVERAKAALNAGFDIFYEDTSWCWGDALNEMLANAWIPFEIVLCDYDDEGTPTKAWKSLVSKELKNPDYKVIEYGYRS